MVFYFTGTGNCLYIAKHLEAQPVSIPQVIHQENLHFCDKSIGIVAPVYGHEVPVMVKEFLHKATFDTDYFYMILTYGNRHGGAAELAEQLCRECGVRVDYINVLLMVDNWLPSFDMDEQRRINKNVQGQLDAILSDLKKRRKMISPVTDTDRAAHRQFLDRMSQMPPDAWQHLLRVTDSCIGCGICEKTCTASAIHVEDNCAVIDEASCLSCGMCAVKCPRHAIYDLRGIFTKVR